MSTTQDTRSWPELAIGLQERLTERNAEITYEASDLEVQVPSHAGPDARHATWRVSGALSIRTRDRGEA